MPKTRTQEKNPVAPAGQPKAGKFQIKKAVVFIAVLMVLGLMVIFAWRVLYFTNLLRTGEIDELDTRFAGQQSQSTLALGEAMAEDGASVVSRDDPYLGSPQAKVTIVEFSDFSCPYCRQSSFVMRALAARYGDQIYYIYRDFPVVELHPQALLAAQAAECAHRQDQFWQYHDKLFINQSQQAEDDLLRYAQELNLDMNQFRVCLKNSEVEKEIMEDFEAGARAGVAGTPTFFINGRRIPGSIPEGVMETLIESILAEE